MASSGDYFSTKIYRIVLNFWAWFFGYLRFLYSPGAHERLHLDGATIRADTIKDTPRAAPFVAFVHRARRHAQFLGDGFTPEAHRAAIAV